MNRTRFISALLLVSLIVPTPALASLQPSENDDIDPFSIFNEGGKVIGSDDTSLDPDAREAKNFVGITASVIEEFTGINTSKYVGYLDLFFGLFKRKKKNQPQSPTAEGLPSPGGTQTEGASDPELNGTLGSAGLPNPTAVNSVIQGRTVQQPKGEGGLFAVPIVATTRTFQRAANLELSKDSLAIQLGVEGQALTAKVAQDLKTATEGANTVADEMQKVTASQDAIKMQGKIGALQAAISQINASETQQLRLAQLENNKAVFNMQELMAAEDWRRTVSKSAERVAVLKSAQTFAGAFKVDE